MKKALSLVLILALSLMALGGVSGCSGEQDSGKLRVLVDLVGDDLSVGSDLEVAVKQLAQSVKVKGGPEDIEFEVLPFSDAERDMALKRLRTEVMAGKGPDVFIVSQDMDDPVFLMPEKSMELGLFYPLDAYMETAQFTDFDSFIPQILEAGRSERFGQMVLPMGWDMPFTLFVQGTVDFAHSPETTWQDMLDDETGVLGASTDWLPSYTKAGALSFGRLADYTEKKLCFTEEELLGRLQELFALNDRTANGAFDGIPMFYKTRVDGANFLSRGRTGGLDGRYRDAFYSGDYSSVPCFDEFLEQGGAVDSDAVTMVPLYSDDGGATASIRSFAAVSANTKRPEDAFFVLDVLFSEESQRSSGLFSFTNALPVDSNLLKPSVTFHGWSLKQANYEEYSKMLEDVTQVDFVGTLYKELGQLIYDCYTVHIGRKSGDVGDMVHDAYRRMELELGE